jgi:hypothetical protein
LQVREADGTIEIFRDRGCKLFARQQLIAGKAKFVHRDGRTAKRLHRRRRLECRRLFRRQRGLLFALDPLQYGTRVRRRLRIGKTSLL